MGCDGGSIPRRDELVRVKKKAEVKDKESELHFQWRCCAATQQPLQEPIVACHLGRLYNKVSLIEALLNKDTLPSTMRHIKSLKDVVNLNLTENPAYNENETNTCAPYICPVSGVEMSGKFRFVTLWTCGCVFAERALKQISTKNCHKCQKPFQDKDVVILNGTDEDLPVMIENMKERQQMQKKKKEKKVKTETCSKASDDKNSTSTSNATQDSSSKNVQPQLNGTGKGKIVQASLLSKRPGSLKVGDDERAKKLKPEYSVAKDPNTSDVYKSLFTTHKSEQEQSRAHWVTYNPFYN